MKTDPKPQLPEADYQKIGIAVAFILLLCFCLFCGLWTFSFVWANDMIGGLGNPYLFWP